MGGSPVAFSCVRPHPRLFLGQVLLVFRFSNRVRILFHRFQVTIRILRLLIHSSNP